METRQGLVPVPFPGRRKIGQFQERIRKSKAVTSAFDFPESVADLVGGGDYWMKAVKAFRWHDDQMGMDPDHEVTFVALGNLLGIDRRNATAIIRKERIHQSKKQGLYYWRDVRRVVGVKLSEYAILEIFHLSAAARACAPTTN